ncbi:MAG: TIGR03987 family protein [Halanaerobiales bacterium]|nr:TIGR03987 family protein [Halanaerobiales bacterium]
MLVFSIISMFLALTFYTLGVWGERLKGIVTKKHVIFFWIGFTFDTIGTTIMTQMTEKQQILQFNLHSITGALAIILMAVHAIWATYVIWKKDENKMKNFHRFSLFVWLLWLIPFVTGMILNMG